MNNKKIKDKEIYNLDVTIAKFIYPRLKMFKKNKCGRPGCFMGHKKKMTDDEKHKLWDITLDKMIYAFEYYSDRWDWEYDISEKEANKRWNKIEEGMNLFMKHFQGLWW